MQTYSVRNESVTTPQPTMRAITQRHYGGPEQLAVREVPVPRPGTGEVLVRVHAAAVDRGTEHLMTGLPLLVRPALGLRGPKNPTPGRDLSGVVAAGGADVEGWNVGDEVIGTASGSFAEYAVVPVARLTGKPSSLSFPEAAALPISGMTALQAVRDAARVEAGQQVLVLGASGGVGSYAVQIAAATGAEVTGVASGPKADFVRSLGAVRALDYTQDFRDDDGRRYDVVIDAGGNRSLRSLRRLLTRQGTLVIVGGEQAGGRLLAGTDRQLRAVLLSPFVPQRLTGLISKENAADMTVLAELAEQGTLRAPIDRVLPLEDAAEALAMLAGGSVRGKLALAVAPGESESPA